MMGREVLRGPCGPPARGAGRAGPLPLPVAGALSAEAWIERPQPSLHQRLLVTWTERLEVTACRPRGFSCVDEKALTSSSRSGTFHKQS